MRGLVLPSLLGALLSASAWCVVGYQPDVMIRGRGDTYYRGGGVYVTTRLNQMETLTVPYDTPAVFDIRVQNKALVTDTLVVTGTAGVAGWTSRYYNALTGGTEITGQVTGSGWSTGTLAAGAYREMRLEVTAGTSVLNETVRTVHVIATSQSDNLKSDMVKAATFLYVGRSLYVSPSGSDSNPGTFEQPFATPGYASRQLQPGDTLTILGGKYVISTFDEDIMDPPTGTANAWVTITGDEGNRPMIAGRDNLFAAMFLGGASYMCVRNLEITHDPAVAAPALYFRGGIDIAGSPSIHILLQNLYIHHIDEMAVNVQDCDQLQIINCRLEYCGFGAIGGPAGAAGGVTNLLVRGCELSYGGHYYRGGDGHDRPYDRPDGFGIEPSNGPIEIVDTAAQHNYGDGLDSKSANSNIHNCVAANNSCDGVKLWQGGSSIVNCLIYGTGDGVGGASPWAGIVIDDASHPGAQFTIENVTLHDNPSRHAYPMYVQYGLSNPIDLTMRNTVVANGYGLVYIGPSVSFTCENNLFYRPGEAEQVEANGRTYTIAQLSQLGAGNIYGIPLFVLPAWGTTGDYRMLAGSPGIDVGTPTGAPPFALDYVIRPQGAGYDMGAYER